MIRIPEVRVIDQEGQQIGIMQTRDALDMAFSRGLDLVEISPTARPPVCKILDYGRYKYELQKKAKVSKKKQHQVNLKEMKYRPKIEEHDYLFKTKHVVGFLKEGYKVKVMVDFRGREIAHQEFGTKIMHRLIEDLATLAIVELEPRMEGNTLTMVVSPKQVLEKGIKHAEDEDQ
jgi:translation initiation factor IF-3